MKLSSKAQEEQLMEVVTNLRQVREERAIRVEELAAYTRIRLAFLQALEEGRFEELPEPVYVQGFIRHYGDAIGLNGTDIAQTVAKICSGPTEPRNDRLELEKKPNLYIPLFVPYILLLAAASFGLFYLLNPQRSSESLSQKKNSQIASERKTVSTSKVSTTIPSITQTSPTPVATPKLATSPAAIVSTPTASPITKINSPVEVKIELQDESWLRVKVDGKTEFEGTLNKGDKKTWTAQKELMIRSGNAGAVLVSANKKQPALLGGIGIPRTVTYTSETVNSR